MKDLWSRWVLATILLLSGVNYFYRFLPHQELTPFSPQGAAFMAVLNNSNFVMVIEKSLELFCAVLLVTNTAAPLALIILAPLIINIFLFHLFLSPGLPVSTLLIILLLHITYHRRNAFRRLFK